MSWQDKINNIEFSIITGDGKIYRPLWKTQGKSKEFNTAVYDFINVEGSLVERKKGKSNKHDLVFWFQGENNVSDAAEFNESALDNRPWIVSHPFYGTLKGQPLNVNYNEQFLGVTEVSVDFWESIVADYPDSGVSVQDSVLAKKNSVLAISASVFSADISPVSADISTLKTSNEIVSASFEGLIDNVNNTDYSNAVAKSILAADDLLTNAQTAIESAHSVLDLPSVFESAISAKISAYESAYESLKEGVESVAEKLFFESQGAALVASLSNALVNPIDSDYVLRTEIESAVEALSVIYSSYLSVMDSNQIDIYDIDNSYIPNVNIQVELMNLVAFTTANLYNFAFDAKQLRTIYTKKNTNVILLTHQYMGLASEENLTKFIALNKIRLKELFTIKKGREIKYFA